MDSKEIILSRIAEIMGRRYFIARSNSEFKSRLKCVGLGEYFEKYSDYLIPYYYKNGYAQKFENANEEYDVFLGLDSIFTDLYNEGKHNEIINLLKELTKSFNVGYITEEMEDDFNELVSLYKLLGLDIKLETGKVKVSVFMSSNDTRIRELFSVESWIKNNHQVAITKIWSVKSRLDTSLNYISNPDKTSIQPDIDAREGVIKYIKNKDKTEQCKFVTAFGCSEDLAFSDMMATQMMYERKRRKNGVVAYHIVQSFKDFETTPEVAHRCGQELVKRLFEGKYECVLATHLDHAHIHNHIIINSTSFVDGSKYKNNFKDYFHDIRGVSDAICCENCLSVIDKPKHRGMHYAEIKAEREGKPTIRGSVRKELDDIIKISYTMKDFWRILEQRGFVICRRRPKYQYTSFIPPNGKKQIRLDKLGPEYTEEAIMERITTARNGIRTAAPSELPKRKVYKYNGDLKSLKPKKLKGFVALYFHYMYFFKIIRRKETPQRVSFFLRDELIKFERYQKQFKFLYRNNIEDGTQLSALQKSKEDKINDLVNERKTLYASRTDENESEIKEKVNEINKELQSLRADVRMCKAIAVDSYKISKKSQEVKNLLKQAEMEMRAKSKNKSRRL